MTRETVMGDEYGGGGQFSEMFEDLRSGEASPREYADELEAVLPDSLLASMTAVTECIGRFAAGEISLKEAERIVRRQGDLHPNHPFFFHMCMTYALQRGDELEADGYAALAKTKADRREETSGEDLAAGLDGVFAERLARIERADEDPFSVFTYAGRAGDHLVNHFLVEDILASESSLDARVLELALERGAGVAPLIVSILGELLVETSPGEIPAGVVFLLRILGRLAPPEALPVLLMALDGCISLPLHEAVLALAKLGSAWPEEVSRGLRKLVFNPAYGEARLGAIEALGLLWQRTGNLEFLIEELGRLDHEDGFYRDMFGFLVSAVLSSGRAEAYKAVDAALERNRAFLDTRTIFLTMQYLKKRDRTKAGMLLASVLAEDLRDLLELYPPPPEAAKRRTLTLAREDALKAAMLENLPMLAEVEERLKTGRDDPCPCGSGKRFRKCCLAELTQMREILLLRGEQA